MTRITIAAVAFAATLGLAAAVVGCGSAPSSAPASTTIPAVTAAPPEPTVAVTATEVAATAAPGGSSATEPGARQAKVAELTLGLASSSGVVADVACVQRVAAQLTDEDAQKLIDAYPKGDAVLSPAGKALSSEIVKCFTASTTGATATT